MHPGSNLTSTEPDSPPPLRVLLIEDNEDDAILTRRRLEKALGERMDLTWRQTLADGLDHLKQTRADVALLDLSLSDCHGIETFERFRSSAPHIPILVLTGHDDEETAIQTVRQGAQDYLVKGQGGVDGLRRAVAYAVERQRVTLQMTALAEELSLRNSALREELDLAREIQRALLPGPPSAADERPDDHLPWRLAHRYLPTDSLAGDFFKVYPLSEGRVGILLCDVMGHGVRSALIAALLCGLIEEFEFEREAPGRMLARLNAGLLRVLGNCRADMFATACYLVVDPARHQLRISLAGHPGPYLLQRATSEVRQLEPERGPALGLIGDARFPETVVPIDADDLLLLYTDGLSEVEDPQGRFFDEVLPDALRRRMAEECEGMLDGLMEDARRFSGDAGFQDDVCLIALQMGRTTAPLSVSAADSLGVPA